MGKTKIDWCDESINFITGCENGCGFCYARGTARRNARMGSARYVAVESVTGDAFSPTFHQNVMQKEHERLGRATRPRTVFIGSMSDLGHGREWLYLDGSDRAKGQQRATAQWVIDMVRWFCASLPMHRFILLTKRPGNLGFKINWPSNVVIGVSITSNEDACRISKLTQKREEEGFGSPLLCASVEPLLDPDFAEDTFLEGLDWIIVGAQTGAGAKKLDRIVGWERKDGEPRDQTLGQFIADAAARIVEWCGDNRVPCFVKENLIRHDPNRDWPRQFPAAFGKE